MGENETGEREQGGGRVRTGGAGGERSKIALLCHRRGRMGGGEGKNLHVRTHTVEIESDMRERQEGGRGEGEGGGGVRKEMK